MNKQTLDRSRNASDDGPNSRSLNFQGLIENESLFLSSCGCGKFVEVN